VKRSCWGLKKSRFEIHRLLTSVDKGICYFLLYLSFRDVNKIIDFFIDEINKEEGGKVSLIRVCQTELLFI